MKVHLNAMTRLSGLALLILVTAQPVLPEAYAQTPNTNGETLIAASGSSGSARSAILKSVVVGDRLATPREVGDVLIVRGGVPVPAELDMPLRVGDIIKTGKYTAVVAFDDGKTEVTLEPNTQIDVLNPSIRAVIGELFVKAKGLFSVKTKYGKAATEGTMFDVRLEAKTVEISVFEGRVRAKPKGADSRSILIEPAQEVVLSEDSPPIKREIPETKMKLTIERVHEVETALGDLSSVERIPPFAVLLAQQDKQSKLIREAQDLLNALGYEAGPIDGKERPELRRAVRKFKEDNKLEGEPDVNQSLIEALREAKRKKERDAEKLIIPQLGMKTPATGKRYDANTLTPAQVKGAAKACYDQVKQKEKLKQLRAELTETTKKLRDSTKQLNDEAARIDQTDQAAIDRYTAKVKKHEEMVQRFDEKLRPNYDREQKVYSRKYEQWLQQYQGKRFWQEDLEAALKLPSHQKYAPIMGQCIERR